LEEAENRLEEGKQHNGKFKKAGGWMAEGWKKAGRRMVKDWQKVGRKLAKCWRMAQTGLQKSEC
jgi:hypothetical protein